MEGPFEIPTIEEAIEQLIDWWTLGNITTQNLMEVLKEMLEPQEVLDLLISIGAEV